jgi:hypothetical protein
VSKLAAGSALYTSERQDWQTPPDFLEKLLEFVGLAQFDLDPCCTSENVPAQFRFHEADNGLRQSWLVVQDALVFMNPPYDVCEDWVKKAVRESRKGARVWGLFPARLDTIYWHEWVFQEQGFVFFIKRRLSFWLDGKPYLVEKMKKNPETGEKTGTGKFELGIAPFPAALVYWGHDANEMANRFAAIEPFEGVLVSLKKNIEFDRQLKITEVEA